jgi:hypothetical protein
MIVNNSRVNSVVFAKNEALDLVCQIARMVPDYNRLSSDKEKYLAEVKAAYEKTGENRKLNGRIIKQYTKDMDEGKWLEQVVESCVLINAEKRLLGGQHRMWSFLHSALPTIAFNTVLNATQADRERQDTGYNRGLADHVVMALPDGQKARLLEMQPLQLQRIQSAHRILANHFAGRVHQPKTDELVAVATQTMEAFEDIAGALDAERAFDKTQDMHRYAPVLAAFVVAKNELDNRLWKQLVLFLQGDRIVRNNEAVDTALTALRRLYEQAVGPSVRAGKLFTTFQSMLEVLRTLKDVRLDQAA